MTGEFRGGKNSGEGVRAREQEVYPCCSVPQPPNPSSSSNLPGFLDWLQVSQPLILDPPALTCGFFVHLPHVDIAPFAQIALRMSSYHGLAPVALQGRGGAPETAYTKNTQHFCPLHFVFTIYE